MIESAALRPKTYSYLMDDGNEHKKTKGTKNVWLKEYLNLIILMIIYLITSQYYNHNKDLKVKHILYILKNPIRLH